MPSRAQLRERVFFTGFIWYPPDSPAGVFFRSLRGMTNNEYEQLATWCKTGDIGDVLHCSALSLTNEAKNCRREVAFDDHTPEERFAILRRRETCMFASELLYAAAKQLDEWRKFYWANQSI